MTAEAIPEIREELDQLLAGGRSSGPRGTVAFAVSTTNLDEGRGDIYVALGLAKYLHRAGWGVTMWPMAQWGAELEDVDVVIVMVDAYVPGLLPESTRRIAWIRNWTDTWIELPYLDAFDEIWSSSSASADAVSERFEGVVRVLPIGSDAELFAGPGRDAVRSGIVTTANSWGVGRDILPAIAALGTDHDVDWYGHATDGEAGARTRLHGPVSFFDLPAVYGAAQIVVDDLIAPAKAYGSHNSRLFEALLSGALPVTNTSRGLEELGLVALPTYESPDDLVRVVRDLLADPTALQDLAVRLRAVAVEQHTWEVRAAVASGWLETVERSGRTRAFDAMLRWAAHERAMLIGIQVQRDQAGEAIAHLSQNVSELREEMVAARRRLLDAQRDARDAREFISRLTATTSYRAVNVVGRVARSARDAWRQRR